MKKLIIDTTDNKKTVIVLQIDDKKDKLVEESIPKSQNTLLMIEKILKKNKLEPKDLEEIEVNTGPGSFTGTRVGVAIANAFGFGLDIKVNGRKKMYAVPKYF